MVRTYTAVLQGLEPTKIEVEVEAIRGTPQLIIIGLPTKTLDEAKERITACLLHVGIKPKSRRTIVNLAPADLPKRGSGLELAIAVSILKLYGQIQGSTDECLFLGELSLSGQIKPIKGALPLTLAARKMGYQHLIIPQANASEVSLVKQIKIHPISHLQEILNTNFNQISLPVLKPQPTIINKTSQPKLLDQILGQDQAKRALTIAAAGGHHILLMGPPGVGKSLLAQSLAELLPPLGLDQIIETTAIHSVVGSNGGQLVITPPLRSPHHTVTQVGLIGGGSGLKPGEISLAHNGILFLDEVTEFARPTLEALRQPLESGQISHVRNSGTATYPAKFLLVAASNPCPCGWFLSQKKACVCSPSKREQYLNKLSGPLLDRIDLQIWVDMPDTSVINQPMATQLSQLPQLKKNIDLARQLQKQRLAVIGKTFNSQMNSTDVRSICQIDQPAWQLIKLAGQKMVLSLRGVFGVLKIAQTIADLDSVQTISKAHVAEALQFRVMSKMMN